MKKPIKSKPLLGKTNTQRPKTVQKTLGIYELQSEISYRLKNSFCPIAGEGGRSLLAPPYLQLFYNLDELLGTLVHEGRNHLGPIKGYASLIGSNSVPFSQETQWANKIIENVEIMERHFDLLSIYRMKGTSAVYETDLGTVIEDAVQTLRFIMQRDIPVRVTTNVHGRYPLHREVVKRTLIHILRNAYEGSTAGEEITVSASLEKPVLSEKSSRSTSALIKVTDRGKGIAETAKSSIWKPFFSTKPNHFGLGLTYVAMAASVLDARVMLDSKKGFGTTVSLRVQSKGGEVEKPKIAGS